MSVSHQSAEELAQNMVDAGCAEEMITYFMACLHKGDKSGGLRLLEERRTELLCEIHKEQSCIEFLEKAIRRIGKASK